MLFCVFWWVHMLTVYSFMVFVPQSKQAHELFAIFNVFFKKPEPAGRLRKIDFEDEGARKGVLGGRRHQGTAAWPGWPARRFFSPYVRCFVRLPPFCPDRGLFFPPLDFSQFFNYNDGSGARNEPL